MGVLSSVYNGYFFALSLQKHCHPVGAAYMRHVHYNTHLREVVMVLRSPDRILYVPLTMVDVCGSLDSVSG